MLQSPDFNKALSNVMELWKEEKFDSALENVEQMQRKWPGNAHLHVLWASLVQLQEETEYSLEDVKAALELATELEPTSAEGAVELGHYLNNVEDNPEASVEVFAKGSNVARQILVDSLLGQVKTLLQLNKQDEAKDCLRELELVILLGQPKKMKENGIRFSPKSAVLVLQTIIGHPIEKMLPPEVVAIHLELFPDRPSTEAH